MCGRCGAAQATPSASPPSTVGVAASSGYPAVPQGAFASSVQMLPGVQVTAAAPAAGAPSRWLWAIVIGLAIGYLARRD